VLLCNERAQETSWVVVKSTARDVPKEIMKKNIKILNIYKKIAGSAFI